MPGLGSIEYTKNLWRLENNYVAKTEKIDGVSVTFKTPKHQKGDSRR